MCQGNSDSEVTGYGPDYRPGFDFWHGQGFFTSSPRANPVLLTEHHAVEAYWGSEGMAALIL